MVRKNRRCGSMPGASTSKKQKACFNSYINPKELYGADAYTRIFGKGLLGRSYPIPTTFTQGMRLVNTFEECFEKLGGEEHPQDKLAALHVSQSVVSLASFQGKTRVFACTGTIIKCEASIMSILTSASLVRCSNDETKLAHKLKIKVLLPNAKSVEGKLWKYDLHYNIAVVNIRALPNLRPAFLYGQIGTGKVIAIGRGFESGELMATSGILQYNNSKLDCQELMVSTCKITKAGIGGPLISSGGNFIGLNFYAKEGAPFLPGSILLKCLRHLELFGRVLQPWLGLRIISLQDVKLAIHEEICNSFPQKEGVYVENVIDGSPAAVAGITVGDVITGLDGVVLSDAQQFHELILDKADDTLEQGKAIPFEVYIRRPSDCFEYIATIRAKQTDLIEQNRWPVPKARWITLHGTRVMLDSWS